MNVRDILSSLKRRWQLTLIGLLATLALCGVAFKVVHPTYEATASVVVLPPADSVQPGGNPYLGLAGLSQVVDVLSRSLSSQETVEAVTASHPGSKFTVTQDQTTSGPILLITADGPTADSSLTTLDTVVGMVSPRLVSLQSSLNIAQRAQITSKALAVDDKPTTVRKSQIRAVIAAGVIALLGFALAIAFIDGLIERRKRAKSSSAPSKSPAQAVDDTASRPNDEFEALIVSGFGSSQVNGTEHGTGAVESQHRAVDRIEQDSDESGDATSVNESNGYREISSAPGR